MGFQMQVPVIKGAGEPPLPSLARGQNYSLMIGSILVDAGRLKPADVEEIRAFAARSGVRFGDAGIKLNRLKREDVEFALARQFNYAVLPRTAEGSVDESLIAAHDPQCAVAEELRTIRSRLSVGWLKNTKRNVLAVTSPERRDGRSWFAANLATVFAQAGKRTLVIDTNLRQPRQHQLFKLKNELGLSALLTGRTGKEIVNRIHPRLRLYVLTSGIIPPNPQELLSRQVFDLLLDRFAAQFDLVVLDTPAATDTADTEILAARAGAAILLTRRNHTRQAKLIQAIGCLERAGAEVIGTVMNEYQ